MKRLLVVLVLLAFVASCGGDPEPTQPSGPSPTESRSPEPSGPPSADDGGPVQDLWIIHGLQGVLADGTTVDLVPDLTRLASGLLGAPVAISSTASFSPSGALGARLATADGGARAGVDVIGGLIRDADAEMVAFFATPQPDGRWPDTSDLLAFNLPVVNGLDGGVPIVADYQFVQVLPRPAGEGVLHASGVIEDPLALLANRLRAESYQFLAVGDDEDPEDLVFVGQIGQVFGRPADPGAARARGGFAEAATLRSTPWDAQDARHRISMPDRSAQTGGSGGGIPAKAKPFFDGQKGGAKECFKRFFKPGASSLKCVKDILDGQKKGAKGANDALNRNFGPDPGEPSSSDPSKFCSGGCGSGRKDPHMMTFDGLRYDLQLVGEFVAARAPDVEVQIRTGPVRNLRNVSFVVAVAVGVGGHVIEVPYGRGEPIVVDGAAVDASPPGSPALRYGEVTIEWFMSGVDIYHRGEPLVRVDRSPDHVDFYAVGAGSDGPWQGLLGNHDGHLAGDLVSRSGQVVDRTGPDVHGVFADSWRLTMVESIFTYPSGTTTETFTDRTFPDRPATVASLSAPIRKQADTLCRLAGIDRQPLLDECILDYGLTGDIAMVHGAQIALAAERTAQIGATDTFDRFVSDTAEGVIEGALLAEIRGGEVAIGAGLALIRTTADRATTLHAVDLATGLIRWSVPDVSPSCRPVVVVDHGVAVQLQRGSPAAGNTVPVALLSFEDGRELARSAGQQTHNGCDLALSVAGSVVLQPSRGTLYAWDASNEMAPLWTLGSGEILYGSVPAVDGHFVVFDRRLPTTLRLRSLDPATGAEVSAHEIAGGGLGQLNVLDERRLAVIADNAGTEPKATTIISIDDGRLTEVWSRVYEDERELSQPPQLAAVGEVIAGWSIHEDGRGLVGFDARTGDVVWRHRATSFDNSAGMVEALTESLIAITPFGGAWIEVVGADGEVGHLLVPPSDDYRRAPDQMTLLPDGRLLATGLLQGPDRGVYILILDP